MTRCFFTIMILAMLARATFGQDESQRTKAHEIQQQCEQYRELNYNAGKMRLLIQSVVALGDGTESVDTGTSVTVYFDAERLRNDRQGETDTLQAVVSNGKYIRALDPATAVVVAPSTEYFDVKKHLGLIHPRWIGMGFNHWGSMESRESRCLRLAKWSAFTPSCSVVDDQIDGIASLKIEYRYAGTFKVRLPTIAPEPAGASNDGTRPTNFIDGPEKELTMEMRHTMWIAPSRGYSLLRCENETKYPDKDVELLSTLNGKYELDGSAGIWFPKTVQWSLLRNGKIISGERITTDDVKFGPQTIDVFTLAGLNLPKGRRISERVPNKRQGEYLWDGEKPVLVPHPLDSPDTTQSDATVNWGWRANLLLANGIGCVLFGVLLLFRRFGSAR